MNQLLFRVRKSGEVSVQEAASMLPAALLDPAPGDRVLDLCAAPGSKTTQLLDMMAAAAGGSPPGLLVANELRRDRAAAMWSRLRRAAGHECCLVTVCDARHFPALHHQTPHGSPKLKFDRVLVDVPCSGDGTVRKMPAARAGAWSAAVAELLARGARDGDARLAAELRSCAAAGGAAPAAGGVVVGLRDAPSAAADVWLAGLLTGGDGGGELVLLADSDVLRRCAEVVAATAGAGPPRD